MPPEPQNTDTQTKKSNLRARPLQNGCSAMIEVGTPIATARAHIQRGPRGRFMNRKKSLTFSARAIARDPSLEFLFDRRGQSALARRRRRASRSDIDAGNAALASEESPKNEIERSV